MWITNGTEVRQVNDGTYLYWRGLGWTEWEPDDTGVAAVDLTPYLPRSEAVVSFASRPSPALAILRGRLNARKTTPCHVVLVGSSTSASTGASTTALGVGPVLVGALQAGYPSGLGTETAFQFSTTAAWTARSTAGVHGYSAGIGGTRSDNYLTSGMMTAVAATNPAAVVHIVGSNDSAANIVPATYKANIAAKIDTIDAALTLPCVHILVHAHQRGDDPDPVYPWSAYGDALAELATERSSTVAFIDTSGTFAALGVPTPDALSLLGGDNIHLTDAGHALMADVLRQAVGTPLVYTAAAASTQYAAHDNFDRADGALGTAPSGQVWEPTGTWMISGGKVVSPTGGVAGLPVALADTSVSCKVAMPTTGTAGLRSRATAATHGVSVYLDAASANVILSTVIASANAIKSQVASGLTAGTVATLRLDVKGSAVTAYLNGAQVLTYTLTSSDLTSLTGTGVGLRQSAASATASNFDDLTVTAI